MTIIIDFSWELGHMPILFQNKNALFKNKLVWPKGKMAETMWSTTEKILYVSRFEKRDHIVQKMILDCSTK